MEPVVGLPVLGPAAELRVDDLDVPRQLVGPLGVRGEVLPAAREQARDDDVGVRECPPDPVEEGGLFFFVVFYFVLFGRVKQREESCWREERERESERERERGGEKERRTEKEEKRRISSYHPIDGRPRRFLEVRERLLDRRVSREPPVGGAARRDEVLGPRKHQTALGASGEGAEEKNGAEDAEVSLAQGASCCPPPRPASPDPAAVVVSLQATCIDWSPSSASTAALLPLPAPYHASKTFFAPLK